MRYSFLIAGVRVSNEAIPFIPYCRFYQNSAVEVATRAIKLHYVPIYIVISVDSWSREELASFARLRNYSVIDDAKWTRKWVSRTTEFSRDGRVFVCESAAIVMAAD